MPQIGPAEILVVLLVGMLVFGPKRLPEIGRQVGRAIRQVKTFQETVMSEIEGAVHPNEGAEANSSRPKPASPTASSPSSANVAAPSGSHAPSRFRAPVSVPSARS